MAELIVNFLEELVERALGFASRYVSWTRPAKSSTTTVILKQGNLVSTAPTVSSRPTPSQVKSMVAQ